MPEENKNPRSPEDILREIEAEQRKNGTYAPPSGEGQGTSRISTGGALDDLKVKALIATAGLYTPNKKKIMTFLNYVKTPWVKLKNFVLKYTPWKRWSPKNAKTMFGKVMRILGRTWIVAFMIGWLPEKNGVGLIPEVGTTLEKAVGIANYCTYEPLYDLSRMAIFGIRREKVYLNSKQDVDGTNSEFNIQGTNTLGAATEENAKAFRIESRLVNEVWSIFNRHALFVPRDVAGVVDITRPGEYMVTSYGSDYQIFKLWKAYSQALNIERLESNYTKPDAVNSADQNQKTQTAPTMGPK